jgi:hypothetical protein
MAFPDPMAFPTMAFPRPDPMAFLLRVLDDLNREAAVCKFFYHSLDSENTCDGVEVRAIFPCRHLGAEAVQNLFKLWMQDIAKARLHAGLRQYFGDED